MNCKLVIEELEKAPRLGRNSYYDEETDLFCAIGWLARRHKTKYHYWKHDSVSELVCNDFEMTMKEVNAIIDANDEYKDSRRKRSVINFIKREFCKDD